MPCKKSTKISHSTYSTLGIQSNS